MARVKLHVCTLLTYLSLEAGGGGPLRDPQAVELPVEGEEDVEDVQHDHHEVDVQATDPGPRVLDPVPAPGWIMRRSGGGSS